MSATANEEEEDCVFLEEVLDKLYDFGNGQATKKKLKSKKNKKQKRYEEEEDPSADHCCVGEDETGQHQSETDNMTPQQTGPSVRRAKQVEVVTFQDPAKKQRTEQMPAPGIIPPLPTTEKKHSEPAEEINLEKARLEVHRFGITGYRKEQQRVFEQDRAVMLGARPPKKVSVNYKVLQQQIRDKKQKAKEEAELQPDLKKKKKKNPRAQKKSASSGSGSGSAPSGQVGRFKNGMLLLSSKEIQKIKGKRGSR